MSVKTWKFRYRVFLSVWQMSDWLENSVLKSSIFETSQEDILIRYLAETRPGDLPTELLLWLPNYPTSGTTSQSEICLICLCVGAWNQPVNNPQGCMEHHGDPEISSNKRSRTAMRSHNCLNCLPKLRDAHQGFIASHNFIFSNL